MILPINIIDFHIIPFLFLRCDHCKLVHHIDDINKNIRLFTKCIYEENITITLCDFCLLHKYLKYYIVYDI